MSSSLISEIQKSLPSKIYGGEERTANYEARLIAEKLTGFSYSQLITQGAALEDKQKEELARIVKFRSTGMPLAYILNSVFFRELELYVDNRVLIPRSETELLVEQVLIAIKNVSNPRILEIGVGSGAVSLAIARECSYSTIFGTDISLGAIDVANMNKNKVGVNKEVITFLHGSLFQPLDANLKNSFDVIVSNPPYIGEDEKTALPKQVLDFEPSEALFADDNGFFIYQQILEEAKSWLKRDGKLIFEISPRHSESIVDHAESNGFLNIYFKEDFNGATRIALIAI